MSLDSGMSRSFDLVRECSDPNIFLRPLEILFAIIVFGIIADFAVVYDSTLNFILATGILAFLAALAFLIIRIFDAATNALASARKALLLAEIGTNVFFAFLVFVAFCVACAKFASSDQANAVKAFCFFGWVAWSASSAFSIRALTRPAYDDDEAFMGQADPPADGYDPAAQYDLYESAEPANYSSA